MVSLYISGNFSKLCHHKHQINRYQELDEISSGCSYLQIIYLATDVVMMHAYQRNNKSLVDKTLYAYWLIQLS